MTDDALVAHALELLDTNDYLTLATVSDDGLPWASPVFGAHDGLARFLWVSSVDAVHSRNLAANHHVGLVAFDSTVPAYHGRAVYARAVARPVDDLAEVVEGLLTYPGGGRGATAPDPAGLVGDASWRLYEANATDVWVLCPREPRRPCPRHDRDEDHRVRVWPSTS